jgi:glutaconate CoA-transferase subunit B
VILFRTEHSRRTLVEKVDFISAPGTSPSNVYRPGGPSALVTPRCVLVFERARARFRLESLHPGQRLQDVVENTGFEFDWAEPVKTTPSPSPEVLKLIRGPIAEKISQLYPSFAASRFGAAGRLTR